MSCAECEQDAATVRCDDEDLQFCAPCSAQLHSKKARQHHRVEPLRPPRLCDECEVATALLECYECGGRSGALVFCLGCSSHLHSRIARSAHRVDLIGRGRERYAGGSVIIDLSESDSEEGNHIVVLKPTKGDTSGREDFEKIVLKEEGKISEKAIGKSANDRDASSKLSQKASSMNFAKTEPVKEECCEDIKKKPRKSRIRKTSATKMERRGSSRESSSSCPESDESDDEYGDLHHIKRGSVTLEAFVVDGADQDVNPSAVAAPDDRVESGMKDRIKKMLELGLHRDTPEIEAQQALKNAQRLLTKHNLQQAEVLKGNLRDTSSLVGGMRVVEIRAKGKGKGRMEAWVQELGFVIADNFDCQYFTKSGTPLKPLRVVFYGISHNADCAGFAFSATFNRITTMSAAYVTNRTFPDDKENQDVKPLQMNQGSYTRVARTNYRKGIVAGLKAAVKSAQSMRKESTSKEERHQDHGETSTNGCDSTSDQEDDEEVSFNTSIPQKEEHCGRTQDNATTRSAERCTAITALVLHSHKVGEEFLKSNGIKLRKRSLPDRIAAWNEEAFFQGKKDADRIDINQRGITGAKAKKEGRPEPGPVKKEGKAGLGCVKSEVKSRLGTVSNNIRLS